MSEHTRQLRVLAVLALSGLLFACAQSQPSVETHPVGTSADASQSVCAPKDNIAACFFAVAEPQGDHSPEPVRDAIRDALNLPLEELRAKRYANYQMEPGQWTFEEAIARSFAGGVRRENGDIVGPDSEGFTEAIKQPEAIPVLQKLLTELEKNVLEYKELEDFRRQQPAQVAPELFDKDKGTIACTTKQAMARLMAAPDANALNSAIDAARKNKECLYLPETWRVLTITEADAMGQPASVKVDTPEGFKYLWGVPFDEPRDSH
jgi:hypothetical protein